jgi:hypothetical protein
MNATHFVQIVITDEHAPQLTFEAGVSNKNGTVSCSGS